MSQKLERRLFNTSVTIEQRDDKPPLIRGHAAVFNQLSSNLGGFRERIKPGAFAKSLGKNPDVRALFNHDPNFILGRTKSGTLRLVEDANGLAYEIDPPDTSVAHDLMESLKRGDVDQSSFGFYVVKDNWHKEDGTEVRELEEVDIHNGDVSPVTYPAYPQTSVALRSLWPEGLPDEVAKRAMMTKMVDGEELPASKFAHVGDPQDPSTWKMPIHDANHARNALARWNQVEGLSAEEKKAALKKIIAACKKFGVDVSDDMMKAAGMMGNSLEDENKELRAQLEEERQKIEQLCGDVKAAQHDYTEAAEKLRAAEKAEADQAKVYKSELEQASTALENATRDLALAERRIALLSGVIADMAGKLGEIKAGPPVSLRSLLVGPVTSLKAVISELENVSRDLALAEQRAALVSGDIADAAGKLGEVKAEPPVSLRGLLENPVKSIKAVISDLSHRLILHDLKAKN